MYNCKNPKTAQKFLIQGDTAAKRVDRLPPHAVKCGDNIIALGEATGHNHVLENAEKYTTSDGTMWAVVGDVAAKYLHQQHQAWILPPQTIWQFGENGILQREYCGEEERKVLD